MQEILTEQRSTDGARSRRSALWSGIEELSPDVRGPSPSNEDPVKAMKVVFARAEVKKTHVEV